MQRSTVSRLLFAASTAATIVSAVTGADRVHRCVKPLMVPALVVGVDRVTPMLGTALTAASVGDVLMIDPDDDRRILLGAAAFAVMQGCYIAMLRARGAGIRAPDALPRYAGWAVAAALLARRSPAVAPGLSGYGLALTTVSTLAADSAVTSTTARRRALTAGGILFTVSDGLILWRRLFLTGRSARRGAEGAVLATYGAAQLLLVEGLSGE